MLENKERTQYYYADYFYQCYYWSVVKSGNKLISTSTAGCLVKSWLVFQLFPFTTCPLPGMMILTRLVNTLMAKPCTSALQQYTPFLHITPHFIF